MAKPPAVLHHCQSLLRDLLAHVVLARVGTLDGFRKAENLQSPYSNVKLQALWSQQLSEHAIQLFQLSEHAITIVPTETMQHAHST